MLARKKTAEPGSSTVSRAALLGGTTSNPITDMTMDTNTLSVPAGATTNAANLDLVWGAADIAQMIGKTRNATFHLLSQGMLPARKIGNQWVASRSALQAFFMEQHS